MDENRGQIIKTTAGEVATELARRGVGADARVTITIEADEQARRARPTLADIAGQMRATAIARGLTTEIFDALLAQP
jgi:hypothetical protein